MSSEHEGARKEWPETIELSESAPKFLVSLDFLKTSGFLEVFLHKRRSIFGLTLKRIAHRNTRILQKDILHNWTLEINELFISFPLFDTHRRWMNSKEGFYVKIIIFVLIHLDKCRHKTSEKYFNIFEVLWWLIKFSLSCIISSSFNMKCYNDSP